MNTQAIIAMAKEAGARSEHWATKLFPAVQFLFTPDDLSRFAAQVAEKAAAKEREEIALEFDKRAVLRDGGPAVGWYEPDEPAEIVRARGTKEGA